MRWFRNLVFGGLLVSLGWLGGQTVTRIKAAQVYTTWLPTFTQENAQRQTDGSWRISKQSKFVVVYLNGVAMSPQVDYTLSGQLITFNTAQVTEADDLVLVWMVN